MMKIQVVIKYLFFCILMMSCQKEKKNKISSVKIEVDAKVHQQAHLHVKEKSNLVYEKKNDHLIEYAKIDTVTFDIVNNNPKRLGRSQMGDNGWSYAEVLNDSIIFAYDDFYFNMKLLNIYSKKIDTVVEEHTSYNFHSFSAIRGNLFRHADTVLYRFDNRLNLKDSITVSENISYDYAQCDFVENLYSTPICINILYPKGFSKTTIERDVLTSIPYLERVSDSTLQYGINVYKIKPLPKNTTFIFHYKNKIYSVYSLTDKYMLLIHHYEESLKGY
ncbi:hypothetical protein Fleli_0349 [Bernardetia litoralis DSM 6794]|uniref:Lipoprotein n=1 Tax=Bernardetia litoralis (strain ATCC 23117 / DSM 6794 / NBRC 15988 / NCIMB 1366 / Fx l1 / Sio-4) TaxID=880071 RepID=I4AFU5_BERLS|nr:hypothetical protein [Bernardetia litoralis]AFM02830.1 hypothetical protein Fleli_0349 [Bernardetia litoralis DSM 6794]